MLCGWDGDHRHSLCAVILAEQTEAGQGVGALEIHQVGGPAQRRGLVARAAALAKVVQLVEN